MEVPLQHEWKIGFVKELIMIRSRDMMVENFSNQEFNEMIICVHLEEQKRGDYNISQNILTVSPSLHQDINSTSLCSRPLDCVEHCIAEVTQIQPLYKLFTSYDIICFTIRQSPPI